MRKIKDNCDFRMEDVSKIIGEVIIIISGCTLLKYLASRTLDYYLDKLYFFDEEKIIDEDLRKLREIHSIKEEINLHRNLILDNDLESRISTYSRYIHDKYMVGNPISDYEHIPDNFRDRYHVKLSVLRTLYSLTDVFKPQ